MEINPPTGRGLRPFLSWKRHGRASALVALLVVLLGLPMVWIKGTSYYIAEAVFQVAPNYQKNLSADKEVEFQSNSQYRQFVNHLSRSVLRYDVLERALARLKVAGIKPCLPPESDRKCIERLQRTVYVYAVADSYMVRVGLHSTERQHLDDIVNAIMDSFLETTRKEQIYGSDERSLALQKHSKAINAEISGFEQQRVELAGLLGLTTFGENTNNPYDRTLAQAREKLALAQIERNHAQATFDAFSARGEMPVSVGRSILEMRLQDTGMQALRDEVVKRSEELGRTIAGLTELHPAYQPAATEKAEINAQLQAREVEFDKASLQAIRARLLASVMQTRQVEKELRARVQDIEAQATTFAGNFREAMRLTSEIRKREVDVDEVRNRLNFMNTERNAIGFVRPITRALPAETPMGTGKTRLLLVLLAAAAALAVTLPMVIDKLDRRILTVGDAERALNIASAAWLVAVGDESTRILARDQFRRFASTLLRNHARGARGAFGFTSVKVGGGATAVILELARSLQQLGSRVLVVDANSLAADSPMGSLHAGLSELLAGNADFDEVIDPQEQLGVTIDVVPFGSLRDTGIQRLDVLKTALEQWSQRYDIVLLDLPPILPSADAELLIDAIGQVFLVVEAEIRTKGEVARARAQLEKLAPDAVGLVVNKVPLEAGDSGLRAQLVETITHESFQTFMSMSWLRLQVQLLALRWQRLRSASRH